MATIDIHGTANADTYDQTATGPSNDWINYYGHEGNDTVRMYNGQVIGGSGADHIEQLPSAEWWRTLEVAYWDAPAAAVVDLQAGWAQDGWGTTDTLIGVDGVNGGGRNDKFWGTSGNNRFSTGGGNDTIDGRDGDDSVVLGRVNNVVLDLQTARIAVSIDGRTAIVTSTLNPNLRVELIDIERIAFDWNQPYYDLMSFIDPLQLATQGLVGAAGQRWNAGSALGAAATVSYSFVGSPPESGPGATGFRAFMEAEQQAVRNILAQVSAVTQLTFVEVAETGGNVGQMRFGVSQQADTKGVAYMPSATPGTAGDVWMDVESMADLTVGTEGYAALLHEIGHALGLRHPRNVDPGDAWAAQWRSSDDVSSLTVMSDAPAIDGLFRTGFSALDVAAMRYLYGTTAVNTGNTHWQVGGEDAAAQRAIVDDGGVDTLDASASPVGVALDLVPGHRSSVGVTGQGLLAFDNVILGVDTWIEGARGSVHDDVLLGNSLANTLEGGLGNDWVDGAQGADTAVFSGLRADYELSRAFGYVYAAGASGSTGFDTLVNVEYLRFDDRTVDLTMASHLTGVSAASVKTLEELYVGFFNRVPEAGGLAYWLGQHKAGVSLAAIANQFYDAGVFFGTYPETMTNAQFVREIYKNVLGRPPGVPPTESEVNFWVNQLVSGAHTKGTMVLQMLSDVHTVFENHPDFGFVAAHLNNKATVAHYYAVLQGLGLNVQADNVVFGQQLAALITPTDTAAAIAFIGVNDFSQLA